MFGQFKIELKPVPVGFSAYKKWGSCVTVPARSAPAWHTQPAGCEDIAGADKENRVRRVFV